MPRDRIWTLIWLGGAVAALVLLAASISGISFAPGHVYDLGRLRALFSGGSATRPIDPASAAFWQTVVGSIAIAVLVCLAIGLIISAELRRELLRRFLTALAAVLLIYLLIGLLRSAPAGEEGPAATGAAPTPAPGAAEPFPTFTAQPAPWLVIAVSILLAALLGVAIWLAWRRARPERPALAQLADEAQAAAADLEAGGDLKDTVLRCYREMSRILGEGRGIERGQSVTAREFERQLAAAGLGDEHIRRLTRLFERVRYGARSAGPREEREALECLTAIAQAYGRAS